MEDQVNPFSASPAILVSNSTPLNTLSGYSRSPWCCCCGQWKIQGWWGLPLFRVEAFTHKEVHDYFDLSCSSGFLWGRQASRWQDKEFSGLLWSAATCQKVSTPTILLLKTWVLVVCGCEKLAVFVPASCPLGWFREKGIPNYNHKKGRITFPRAKNLKMATEEVMVRLCVCLCVHACVLERERERERERET